MNIDNRFLFFYSGPMLTQQDLKKIEELVDKKLDQKIKFLPTKDHFDKRIDELMGEVQTMREEQTLHQGQHDEITEHLDRLDKHVGLPSP